MTFNKPNDKGKFSTPACESENYLGNKTFSSVPKSLSTSKYDQRAFSLGHDFYNRINYYWHTHLCENVSLFHENPTKGWPLLHWQDQDNQGWMQPAVYGLNVL